MPAFAQFSIDVTNPQKLQEYAAAAGPTIQAAGGEVLLRGKLTRQITGHANGGMTAIIRFDDLAALEAWYASPDYQSTLPIRNAIGDVTVNFYETVG